jgi:hypothetical protein
MPNTEQLGVRREEDGCCSGNAPLVTMVETADLRNAHDPSLLGRLYRTRLGRIFLQCQVTAAVMVIVEETM